MDLTDEQRAIVTHEPRVGAKVMINAFAGCGKTSTLRNIVIHRRDKELFEDSANVAGHRKFLYLVFNRDAERAAKTAFYDQDDNSAFVQVRTHHSLALKFFIEKMRLELFNFSAEGRLA